MTKTVTVDGWLHGDDLKEKKIKKVWANNMQIHTIATYVVGNAIDMATINVTHMMISGNFTDSDSDGTVGSDNEYHHAIDAEWDLVAI